MIAQISGFRIRPDGKQEISFITSADLREKLDRLRGVNVKIDLEKWRDKRSLDANALFHVLVNKIAAHENLSDKEVKRSLVEDYGALAQDEDGQYISVCCPISVDITELFPYTRLYKETEVSGQTLCHYLIFKRTREMNSKEMSRLISGAMTVAEDLGIDTVVSISSEEEIKEEEVQENAEE